MEDVKGDEEGDCVSEAVVVTCFGDGEDFVSCLDGCSGMFLFLFKLQ